MSTLFVTATGTEIGKTLVTCALVEQLRKRDRGVRAIKPVVSGFDEAGADDSDCALLMRAQGQEATELDRVSPWRFRAALSPDMAAAAENREVPFVELIQFCQQAEDSPGLLLIEGIGGAMVPLDATHTVLDWISALEAPTVVVTGSYLGALSHTLTTCAAIAGRGIHIQAVLVSESSDSTVDLHDSCATLERFLTSVPVMPIPRLGGPEPWRDAPDLLAITGLIDRTDNG